MLKCDECMDCAKVNDGNADVTVKIDRENRPDER
jgi:hypothetical protein